MLPRIAFSGLVSNGDKSTVMLATGVDPDAEFAVKGPFLKMVAGDVLASGSTDADVMLGDGLARSLKAMPGSGLTLLASTTDGALNAIDVRVKGVFSTGVPDIDKRLVYTDLLTAQRLLNTKRVSTLGVFLDRMESTDAAQARVAALFPKFTVQTWLDQAFFYASVHGLYNRIFGALGLIIATIRALRRRQRDGDGDHRTHPRDRHAAHARHAAFATARRTRARRHGAGPRGRARRCARRARHLAAALRRAGADAAPAGQFARLRAHIDIDPGMYAITIAAIVILTTLASAWIARKTVHMPLVDALAHT